MIRYLAARSGKTTTSAYHGRNGLNDWGYAVGYNLPVAQYDYLKELADRFGGVGHSVINKWDAKQTTRTAPCCVWGLAQWDCITKMHGYVVGPDELGLYGVNTAEQIAAVNSSWNARQALHAVGLYGTDSDRAFTDDERKDPDFRLPFDVWAERLGVVCGG